MKLCLLPLPPLLVVVLLAELRLVVPSASPHYVIPGGGWRSRRWFNPYPYPYPYPHRPPHGFLHGGFSPDHGHGHGHGIRRPQHFSGGFGPGCYGEGSHQGGHDGFRPGTAVGGHRGIEGGQHHGGLGGSGRRPGFHRGPGLGGHDGGLGKPITGPGVGLGAGPGSGPGPGPGVGDGEIPDIFLRNKPTENKG